MTRPKPKTVRAWAFSVRMESYYGKQLSIRSDFVQTSNCRDGVQDQIDYWHRRGATCGPVVRIEVPAPKERRR